MGNVQTTAKITPFLWFDGQVEEAAKFYTSIFKDSKIIGEDKFLDNAPSRKKGDVLTVQIECRTYDKGLNNKNSMALVRKTRLFRAF